MRTQVDRLSDARAQLVNAECRAVCSTCPFERMEARSQVEMLTARIKRLERKVNSVVRAK